MASTLMDDDTYRLFIKAKIMKNVTGGTVNETIDLVNFLFNTDTTLVTYGGAAGTIVIGRLLTPIEQELLNRVSYSGGYPSRLVPVPLGVNVNFGHVDASQGFFAFEGVPGGKGFACYEGDPDGGKFVTGI